MEPTKTPMDRLVPAGALLFTMPARSALLDTGVLPKGAQTKLTLPFKAPADAVAAILT
jgi:hypothetical protein